MKCVFHEATTKIHLYSMKGVTQSSNCEQEKNTTHVHIIVLEAEQAYRKYEHSSHDHHSSKWRRNTRWWPRKIKEKKESMNSTSVCNVFHHENKHLIGLNGERLPNLQRAQGRLHSSTAGAANGLLGWGECSQASLSSAAILCRALWFPWCGKHGWNHRIW